jgi:DNA gyrase subunit A
MSDQLTLLESGNIISTALHTEVQQSYLEYAMSVIVGRALPDVRDGLKPVHRRILYAMHELGLTPDRPYRKCARVVGDVLGKYHPHGDQSVYDALVRMVQTFSSRYPLLEGHGNFGSVDDDPPAAMRYTETRLAAVGNTGLLAEIGEATVDFTPNFDNSQQEPAVLPAQLPILLLNGCSGIAVGMATNIPPHNAGEVIDGLIALIDNPNLSDEQLWALIPAPDFPTGGQIIDRAGIRDAYRTGRGSIPLRGVIGVEEISIGKGKHRRMALVTTELPFQVNKASWIEKIAELVNQGRLDGISDLRDESDRDGMRVVIELKRDAQPNVLIDKLYKLTPLQVNFGAIMLALVNNQPRQLPLRDILQEFLAFREETLTRQYRHELDKAEQRAHILEGLLVALDVVDLLIDILRSSPDGTTAKVRMQAELQVSDRQADAILAMPMRRLTGLEQENLQQEFNEISERMQELNTLLTNRKELLKSLKKDLRSLRKQFSDERRTRIVTAEEQAEEANQLAALAEETSSDQQDVVLEFTQKGYVRRHSLKAFEKQQAKQEETPLKTWIEGQDFTLQTEPATTEQELLVLTKTGKAYTVKVGDIPATVKQSKGTPLITFIPATPQGNPEVLVTQYVLSDELLEMDLIMLTQQGKVKRLPLSEFRNLSGRGMTAMKLKEPDELLFAIPVFADDQLILATSGGRILRFTINDQDVPVMSRAAQGQSMIRLMKKETIAGCTALSEEDDLVLMTTQGYGKRMPVSEIRATNRGGLGVQITIFHNKTDMLAGVVPGFPGAEISLLTDGTEPRMARVLVDDVPAMAREEVGDRILKLGKGEKIATVAIAALAGDEEEEVEEE